MESHLLDRHTNKPHTASAGRRRSLAWHIARRPNGLVALAIRYGHLRTTLVSDGYASRSRGGIHELIDVETVRAVADTVADLKDGSDFPRRPRDHGGHRG